MPKFSVTMHEKNSYKPLIIEASDKEEAFEKAEELREDQKFELKMVDIYYFKVDETSK
jgi:hypothetical protein